MLKRITKGELAQAQVGLVVAIFLQILVWHINHGLTKVQFFIVLAEVVMLIVVSFGASVSTFHTRALHQFASFGILLLISVANVASLVIVISDLINGGYHANGKSLLAATLAIFLTNIIIFALWYWEIDSPGLTRRQWTARDKDFQFTQYDIKDEYKDWKPEFFDYLYLSMTNAVNFASADVKPVTKTAKMLMGVQAMISVFTLALVLAKSVSILG